MYLEKDFTSQLAELNRAFNTDIAIISHIVGQDYTIEQLASELDIIQTGQKFIASETYCNAVIDSGQLIIYNQVGVVESMLLHPVYTAMQLESYIGHPLFQNNQIVGTLNFSGFEVKSPPFSDADIQKVKTLAKEIETFL